MLLTALLPLALAIGFALWQSSSQVTKLTLESTQGRLDSAAQKLSSFFSERIVEVSTYSRIDLIKTMDFAQILPFFMKEIEQHGDVYEKFILGTTEGYFYNTSGGNPYFNGLRTFDDSDPDSTPKHIRKRDYWQQTVGENEFAKPLAYVSDPMISYTTGAKQIVVASSILSTSGEVKGMIGGALPWADIQERIKIIDDEIIAQVGSDSKLFLVSHTGVYWYHWDSQNVVHLKSDENGNLILNDIGEKVVVSKNIQDEPFPEMVDAGKRMLRGESGYLSYTDVNTGDTSYIVFSPVPSVNYSIGLIVPQNQILSPVQQLETMFGLMFFSFAALVIIAAFFVSSRISSPIVSLSKMAKEISQGNWSINLNANGSDEICELKNSFNTMSESLERRENSLKQSEERLAQINMGLEKSVEERTEALQRNEELLNRTGKIAHVGGWKYDVVGNHLSWTREMYRLHGLADGINVTMSSITEYFSGDSRQMFNSAVTNALENGESFDLELSLINVLAEELSIRVLCHVKKDGDRIIELNGVYQDISELKELDKLKREFVATVSHELRTPLTSISGALKLLNSGKLIKIEDKSALQMLEIAERNSERLLALINDLLDMEKIELGKMDFNCEPYLISELLNRSIIENEAFASQFGVQFKILNEIPNVHVNVDEIRFLQVMSNLLSNAAKFTRSGSDVEIFSRITGDGRVKVSVRDFGEGIPENSRNSLFKKFSQVDGSNTRKQGGTGLGLVICRAIIERMDGEIDYESIVGEGTVFYFDLPLNEPKQAYKSA